VGETFGEDPFLIGELASAMVRGYQGRGLRDETAILATAKHFAGYSETQGGRDASEADISRRKLRSWFLPPFERVAREGCATFMLGYQTTDGVPITVNDWLLDDVLRGEWGYTGTLITDWDNVGRMVWEQKIQPDYAHAAAAPSRRQRHGHDDTGLLRRGAGGDRCRPPVGRRPRSGRPADSHPEVRARAVRESTPARGGAHQRQRGDRRAHGPQPRRRAALARPAPQRRHAPAGARRIPGAQIAVVGPLADDAQTQLGDWAGSSGQVDWMPDGQPRSQITTVLDGLRELLPSDWELAHARGADILTWEDDPAGSHFPDGQPRPRVVVAARPDEELIAEAVAPRARPTSSWRWSAIGSNWSAKVARPRRSS
jgi:beta-glucosidase